MIYYKCFFFTWVNVLQKKNYKCFLMNLKCNKTFSKMSNENELKKKKNQN